jgi:hypothetical protein
MRDLPRGTQVVDNGARSISSTGLSPALARRSRRARLSIEFLTPPRPCRVSTSTPTTPTQKRRQPIALSEFGLFPFRSPLLRECSLFLQLLRCFSSLAYLRLAYLIQPGVDWTSPAGFPHSDISGSASARDSPKLFAACHVLHRLLAPRHPPRALCSLTPSASDQAIRDHTGPYRNSSDNTAKSKILTSISTDHISSW